MAIEQFFKAGWYSDPAAVQASIQARQESGHLVMGSDYVAKKNVQLPGAWKRFVASKGTGIFLRDAEIKLLGTYRRPFFQKFGTCVSRGTCKGGQVSLDYSIVKALSLKKPTTISFAPIYSLARVEVGKNRCGNGDGAILADAARAVHDYGFASEELFAGCDEDETEKLAVYYATPGRKTPETWINACKGHTAVTFWPEEFDLIADCLAMGYAVPYAMNYITAMPNRSGISDLGSFGPHCRCFTGVFIDEHGETQFVSSESWGSFPARDPQSEDQTMPVDQMPRVSLHYAGGLKTLAPGDVGVNAKRFYQQIRDGGEAWAIGGPDFSADSVASLSA